MSERNFEMRLLGTYEGDTNAIASLEVRHKVNGQWEPLELALDSPGFDIFVYSIFTCQHRFFRVNCAERNLVLNSAEGSIVIGADRDWNMETLQVNFTGRLDSGEAGSNDIDYIVSRMQQCPVSRNIREIPDAGTTVILR